MENASRALLIAASVLLGIMIISVGVALFNSFSGSSENIMNQIERARIAEFNNQFLKYYEAYDKKTENADIVGITAHDIVTITNLAKKNNIEYEVENQNSYNENSLYIQVDVNKTKNFEKQSEEYLTSFLEQNNNIEHNSDNNLIKNFYVKNIEISKKTGRVMHVEILEK